MLFLIGTKDSNIKNGFVKNEICPKCNIENTLHFSIFRRYVYITFIPLFPVGKIVNIECTSCKNWFYYEDLSLEGQEKLRNEKLKNSIWMFSGTFVLLLFLAYCINNYFQNQNQIDILIKEPLVGDVYNLKFSNGYYSTFKIDKITSDSIYTTHNDFDTYMPYEIDDLDKAENYSNKKVSYSKNDLIKLYNSGEIIKIRHKD
ncbi:hypothetical protein HNP37_003457 [Flavobacterium nitrogenifigens]|uniref:Zinc-ribbon 15 domain-containing protein n=2 Tax=Flavobacterium TaxID=237 RepID=A0A7W7J071_9FLAO|nr:MULTISPECIES: hypothetical protein [Flavobacterium]MBB4803382.1 hypothetical protein [Flavobacterium nitrogenifigens]MBB6388340.1 hypothetical protein [Flavobacterium notoginsengisoli]